MAPDPFVGRTIGPCELLEFLAEGSSGRVYRAQHTRLDTIVAVKVVTPTAHNREELLRRFQREAQVSARLNHPNIVRVYDFNEDGELHYMIQEFVSGASLAERVEREGPVSDLDMVSIAKGVAEALEAIHNSDLIHRDLKPENILLTAKGAPKLVDFGIAKDALVTSDTHQDTLLGTPRFMAPEQVRDRSKVGPPTDLFGLGGVVFFGLTGAAPIEPDLGEELLAFLDRKLRTRVPELSQVRPKTQPKLAALVHELLHPDPDARPLTADVVSRLKEIEAEVHLESGRWKVPSRLFNRTRVFGGAGTTGLLQEMPLPEILQGIEFNQKTGELTIEGTSVTGRIAFRAGQPIEANTTDGLRDEEAILRLLGLAEGSFSLSGQPPLGEAQVRSSFTQLLLDHARTSDEGPAPSEEEGSEQGEDREPPSSGPYSTIRQLRRAGQALTRRHTISDLREDGVGGGDPLVGQRLGPFRVGRALPGACPRRYEAKHEPSGEACVLSVFQASAGPTGAAEHKALVERMQDVRGVEHALLAPCLDAGSDRDRFFVGYPPLGGRTLRDELAEGGAWSPKRVQWLLDGVALALQALHSHHDQVHGHISLDTIRVEDRDLVVAEAGLCRTDPAHAFLATQQPVPGAPGFTAPEVLDGEGPSPGADLYALGVVAWSLLSGQAPEGPRWPVEAPPLESLDGAAPEGLRTITAKLTCPDPRRRYANASELLADLGTLERGKRVAPLELDAVSEQSDVSDLVRRARRRAAFWRQARALVFVANLALFAVVGYWLVQRWQLEPVDPLSDFQFRLSDD